MPVLKHVCARLIILTGGKNNHKIKIAVVSWQLAVGSRHTPLRLQIYFLSFPKMLIALTADRIDCLYGEGGGVRKGGSCSKMG